MVPVQQGGCVGMGKGKFVRLDKKCQGMMEQREQTGSRTCFPGAFADRGSSLRNRGVGDDVSFFLSVDRAMFVCG